MKRYKFALIAVLMAIALLFSACGLFGGDEETQPEEATPVAETGDGSTEQPQELPTTPIENPTGEQPVEEQPTAEQPVAEQPTTEQPTEEQPVAEQPIAEQPTTEPGGGGEPVQLPEGSVSTQHTVQEREWLVQVARCYGTSPADVIAANNIPYPGWIMAGETWNIPNVGSVGTAVGAPCIMFYTVQQGDTLYSIANKYSIPLDMLVFANYGCYGYNAHYDWIYNPAIPTPYNQAQYWGYGGCSYTGYPMIYPGDSLVIPVTVDNVGLRP